MGKKCPGPKHCSLRLEGEIKDLTEQQGGIGVDVDILQELIQSTPKQQLVGDRLTRTENKETSLRDRVLAMEEALEENNDHLDQILVLLKKKEEPCVNSSGDEGAVKPSQYFAVI